MNKHNQTQRAKRIRLSIRAVSQYPRLSVFRSNAHIWAQIIDDTKGITLVSAHSKSLDPKLTKLARAALVGEQIASLAKAKKIAQVVFDRGSYRYHGRVKALAESARQAGLKI